MSSQQIYTTKKKQPKVPKTPTNTNSDSVFWNSSTQSPSLNLHLEDSAVNESVIPQVEGNIHDALTQVEDDAEIEQPSEIIPRRKSFHEQETQIIPRRKSFHEQETQITPRRKAFHEHETQVIPNDTIHSIHDQETQAIPKGIETINEQETRGIPEKIIHEPNSEMDDEEETETIGALEIEVMNKRNKEVVTKKNVEMRENAQENRVVVEKNPKLLIHEQETQVFTMPPIKAPKQNVNIKNPDISANELADSEICIFDVDEESESPDSPDSMSLLENETPDECDPYEQDTQIMEPIIPPPVQSSGADDDDDELTQVLDDHLIVPRHTIVPQAQKRIDKGDMFKSSLADNCLDSQLDEIVFSKPVGIGDSDKVDLTQKKVETIFDIATQKAQEGISQEANVLDLPTQKYNKLDMPTQEVNVLDMPTQEVSTLKLPTKKNNIVLDMPTQEDNTMDMLTQKIDPTNSKKVVNVIMSENTKGTSPKDNIRPVQKLSANDFKIGSSLSNQQQFRSNSYVTPIKRQVLADSNSFSFSTPANVEKKKKGKLIPSDASFDTSVITHTINELNSSTSSLKSINSDEENYYNNTRELEDDLLSQTVVSVTDKSPATSKTITTAPLSSAAGGKNYYGCTQDIMEDLLTQKLDCNNISPVKPSPVVVSPLQKRGTAVLGKSNENKNYYAFTQDIVNELLTQEEPQPDLQEPSFEKCSTDLLFSKLPKPISFSQSSDTGSDILEVTPLKRFRNTISDSDLDSPQIKNFALRGQPLQCSSSDNELEEDSAPLTEEDAPIVHRRAVPKKKPKNQPVEVKQKPPPIVEAKQTRVSARVRKDVTRLIEEETVHKSSSLSLKNKPKLFRRTSVCVERLPDELVGVSKMTNIPSDSANEISDKGAKRKAKREIDNIIDISEDLPSTSNVKSSVIEKGSKGRQNSCGKQELKPSTDIDGRSGERKCKTNTDSSSNKVSNLSTDAPETSITAQQKRLSNRRAKKDHISIPDKINNLFDTDDSEGSRDKTVNSNKRNAANVPEAPVIEKRGRGSRCKIEHIDTSNSGIREQMEERGIKKIKKETRAANSPAKITDKREDPVPKKISSNESVSKEVVEADEKTSRREVEKPVKNSGKKRPADPEDEVPNATLKRAPSHSKQRKINIKRIMSTQITDLKALEVIPKLGQYHNIILQLYT